MDIEAKDLPIPEFHKLILELEASSKNRDHVPTSEEVGNLPSDIEWWQLYEYDFRFIVSLLLTLVSEPDDLDPNAPFFLDAERLLNFGSGFIERTRVLIESSTSKEDVVPLLSLLISLQHVSAANIRAIAMFGLSHTVCELIKQARENDNKEALLDAILVDSLCIYTPTAQKLITTAALTQDATFLEKLGAAVAGTRDRRTDPAQDHTRLLHTMIEDIECSKPLTKKEFCHFFIDQLNVYPSKGKKDDCGSLWRLIQRLRKQAKK